MEQWYFDIEEPFTLIWHYMLFFFFFLQIQKFIFYDCFTIVVDSQMIILCQIFFFLQLKF